MRIIFLALLLSLLGGCQSAPQTPTANTDTAEERLSAEDLSRLEAQYEQFLTAPDLPGRLQRLVELEQQALQLSTDEPLKLGSLGSAILDLYPGSQTGHLVLAKFYAHVEVSAAQVRHAQALREQQQFMRRAGADGTLEAPFHVMTALDAHAFARSQQEQPVGSMYLVPELTSLQLLLVARPADAALHTTHFDLSHLIRTVGSGPADRNAWRLLREFATQMDSAAQTAIGRMMLGSQRYQDATGWLQAAARSGNVLANIALARLYLQQLEQVESSARESTLDLVMENYLHAIALGSTEAMYTLANLYINDYYGADNRSAAIPLLLQAGDLGTRRH